MARRSLTEEIEHETVFQPAATDESEQDRPARRRSKALRREREESSNGGAGSKKRTIRWSYVTVPVAALVVSFVLIVAFHQFESYVINNPHFALEAAREYGEDPPAFQIEGLERASKAEVLRVLEKDLGRSLYLFDASERRRNLLAVDWIREATVARRWPNRVHIQVVERKPAAFVQINRTNSIPRFFLIDSDGVLLPIPKGEKFDRFVVLTGLSGREPEASRGIRVRQALHLLEQAGPLGAFLSEIDVRDPGDLQATLKVDTGVVAVHVGSKDFGVRLRRFLKHYPDIQKRRPEARTFDLRMDDRIIAVDEAARNGS